MIVSPGDLVSPGILDLLASPLEAWQWQIPSIIQLLERQASAGSVQRNIYLKSYFRSWLQKDDCVKCNKTPL